MLSVVQHSGPVQQYQSSKKEAGRIARPFREQDMPVVCMSVILALSQRAVVKWCLILNLSFPPDKSVNDGIDQQLCSLRYPTVDQAIAHILQVGCSD